MIWQVTWNKKLYDYNINGNVAKKTNPQNKFAQYNIPLKFVINILFRGNGKIIKKISWEYLYLELINSKLYFSWYSLAELINSINDKSLYELKTMNFKLLMKIQELVENTCDIKLKNKNNIIEKFKNDYSEIINNNQKNHDSKLETQKKIHENTVSKLTGEIKALQILNKSYDQIICDIDKIKDLTRHTFNSANYCYKYTIIGVDNLKQTIKSMKTNTEEFNKNYDNFIIESEELVNTMSYYLNDPRKRIALASSRRADEPLGENDPRDNDNINEIKTQITELKNGKIQNTTHKNMCSILTKLNSYVRNIKKDIINTYDSKTTNKNIKEINKLFANVQFSKKTLENSDSVQSSKETLELDSSKKTLEKSDSVQLDSSNKTLTGLTVELNLNLNQIGKPIIFGKDSLVFPIILTNDIRDSMPLTYVEGIMKAYNIPSSFLHTFYELKAKRDFKNKNGTMVPYIKMNI
jgi:hypothetical protein